MNASSSTSGPGGPDRERIEAAEYIAELTVTLAKMAREHQFGYAERGRVSGPAARGRCACSASRALRSGLIRRQEPLVRVEQAGDVLAWFKRAEEEDVAVGGRRRPRRPCRPAVGADRDPLGGDAELAPHVGGGGVRGHDDLIGLVRVLTS